MKILHISDLHYRESRANKASLFVEKVFNTTESEGIDLVLFTGDLVDKRNCSLEKGYDVLNEGLVQKLNSNIILSCGNHDIDRTRISRMFVSYVKGISSEKELSQFVIKNQHNDFDNTIKHMFFK